MTKRELLEQIERLDTEWSRLANMYTELNKPGKSLGVDPAVTAAVQKLVGRVVALDLVTHLVPQLQNTVFLLERN